MTGCEGSITWGDRVTVLRLTQARTCRPGDAGCQRGAGWNGLSGRRYARTAGVGYRFEPVEVEQVRLVQTSLQRMVDHNVIVQRTAYAYLNALKKANGTYAPLDAWQSESRKARSGWHVLIGYW